MKTKVGRKVPSLTRDNKKDIEALYNHVQAITDDLTQVITGGLLVQDGNLPFSLYKKEITSGIPFEIAGYAATVVFTSSKLVGFQTFTLKSNLLQCTVTIENGGRSDCVFLVIKEPTK